MKTPRADLRWQDIPRKRYPCANHPDRTATVWAKFDADPPLNLCDACHEAEVRKRSHIREEAPVSA